jgi:ergothioneine biosynthesis protein EgtB
MMIDLKSKPVMQLFHEVRARTVTICAPLNKEDFIPQPAEFVSPVKWHLAHTTWFFEDFILKPYMPGYKVFDPAFSFLFNSYYQGIGERLSRASRGFITRPGVDEVFAYRNYVDMAVDSLITAGDVTEEVMNLIQIGCNHEQQHQELLLTDLKYTLSLNPLRPVYDPVLDLTAQHNAQEGYLHLSEGVFEIGFQGDGFCFDNELGRHKVYVQESKISKALVTNKEYLEFIQDGGYKRFDLWLDEGWAWVNEHSVTEPLYWGCKEEAWSQFTLAGMKSLDPDAILSHISFYEASAFAEWSGKRLLREDEWEVASAELDWGSRWEWTNSAYLPYPGFKTAPGALGEYNGKFMVNQMVLRGSSSATAHGHSRNTYRNFFHPHLQWQFAGIRLAL